MELLIKNRSMGIGNKRDPFQENSYYHIYNRGYNKQLISHNTACYKRFYETIIKLIGEYEDIQISAYCLLPNHFHFVLHNIGEESDNISKFMKRLQGSYALWHRAKYPVEQKQMFFKGRFKAKLIDSEEYLYKCMAYVSFNPLKHEIVTDINDYKWTSYHQLSSKQKVMKYRDLELRELEL